MVSGGLKMLAMADRQQGFFDAAWCSELLPEGSIYALLAEHGDRIVRDEDFADCYSESTGRPSIPPSLLAKVLLLAYRDGLSDERAMDAVRFDLRWKVALDLPVDHPGFHPTSLVRFRARLLLHGKERLVFERSLELATELGLLCGPAEQILDSTPMLGAAAAQDTATLVRSAVRKLLDAVKAADGRAAEELTSGLRLDYSRPREKPAGDWQDKAAREALLAEVARDAERALRAVAEDELAADAAIAEAAKLLREIVGQEFELADDELPRPRGGRRSRRILSAEDPEMRHARSSAARPFSGYKIHAAADAEAPLLTAIALSPGNEHDGQPRRQAGRPAARTAAPGPGDRRHRLRQHRGPRGARAALDLGAGAGPQHLAEGRDDPQGRVSDRPRGRHRHLPPGQDEADLQAEAEPAKGHRRSGRPVLGIRLRALPAA
jgi:transposase